MNRSREEMLVEELRTPSKWCCIFEHEGQPRHGTTDAPFRAADALAIAQKRVNELEAKARALVDKLDECAPAVANLSVMQFVRSGVRYTGPSYGEALEELRAALPTMLKGNGDG